MPNGGMSYGASHRSATAKTAKSVPSDTVFIETVGVKKIFYCMTLRSDHLPPEKERAIVSACVSMPPATPPPPHPPGGREDNSTRERGNLLQKRKKIVRKKNTHGDKAVCGGSVLYLLYVSQIL
jgi:hypothetical protein